MKEKIKAIGIAVTIVVTIVMSLALHINPMSKYGGLMLLPVLYFLLVYVVPYMVKDYIAEWKEIIADGEVCFTKDAYLTRCIEEATGEKIEKIEHIVEGEEVNDYF